MAVNKDELVENGIIFTDNNGVFYGILKVVSGYSEQAINLRLEDIIIEKYKTRSKFLEDFSTNLSIVIDIFADEIIKKFGSNASVDFIYYGYDMFNVDEVRFNNIENLINENLQNIKDNNANMDYEIYADITEFADLIKLGKTSQERLQILIMCYYVNPTLEELKTLDIDTVVDYIKETDEYWNKDKRYIQEYVDLINEVK